MLIANTLFVYDQEDQLLGEYFAFDGTAIREYVWLGGMPVALVDSTGVNERIYYVQTDHLDTPRVVLDRSGAQRWTWLAEPFGNSKPVEDPIGYGPLVLNLRFPGQYWDSETEMLYNWNRTYDAGVGRYTQSDPIGLAGGINTYAYVGGNPVNYVDPDGLQIAVPAPILAPIAGSLARPSVGTLVDPVVTPGVPNPNDPNNSQKCKNLQKRIKNLKDEVYNKRYPDLQNNPGNLPRRIGPGEALSATVRGHEVLLNRQLRRLRDLENQYDKECLC